MSHPAGASTFSTRDFYPAAALLANGARFLRIDRQGNVGFFVFADQPACDEMISAYFQRSLVIPAIDFTNAIRTLKDMLHSGAHGAVRE